MSHPQQKRTPKRGVPFWDIYHVWNYLHWNLYLLLETTFSWPFFKHRNEIWRFHGVNQRKGPRAHCLHCFCYMQKFTLSIYIKTMLKFSGARMHIFTILMFSLKLKVVINCVCVCVCVCVYTCLHAQLCLSTWNFPGENTGVGCHFLLWGIFLTQGSNPHLLCFLHWQADCLPTAPSGKASHQLDPLKHNLLKL